MVEPVNMSNNNSDRLIFEFCFTSSKPIPLKQAPSGAVKLELLGQYWGVLPYPNPGHSYEKKLGKLRPVSDVSIRV